MILAAGDIIDWIADHEEPLITAWTPEIQQKTDWDGIYPEVFAGELYALMLKVLLGNGVQSDLLKMIAQSNTGLKPSVETAIAENFYDVTLKLARAASRHARHRRVRAVFPYLRTLVVGDARTASGHRALEGIVLPYGNPFWSRWHPPLDMSCRCTTVQMTVGQLCRHGAVTGEEEVADRETRLVGKWPQAFEPLLEFRRS